MAVVCGILTSNFLDSAGSPASFFVIAITKPDIRSVAIISIALSLLSIAKIFEKFFLLLFFSVFKKLGYTSLFTVDEVCENKVLNSSSVGL